MPKRNKHVGVLVSQTHFGVQARVPNPRDSRVAEARGILRGPWSMLITGLFLRPFNETKEVV